MSYVLDLQAMQSTGASAGEAMSPSSVSPIFCVSGASIVVC